MDIEYTRSIPISHAPGFVIYRKSSPNKRKNVLYREILYSTEKMHQAGSIVDQISRPAPQCLFINNFRPRSNLQSVNMYRCIRVIPGTFNGLVFKTQ